MIAPLRVAGNAVIAVEYHLLPTLGDLVLALWRASRPLRLFAVDVALCLGSIVQPALWSAAALAVIRLIGVEFAYRDGPGFAGFVVGALSMCVVLVLLVWADRRHGWWSR